MRSNLNRSDNSVALPKGRIEEVVDKISVAYRQRSYATLFYSVVFTIACGPLIHLLHLKMHLIEVFLAFNLLAAIVPITSRRGRLSLFVTILAAGLLRTAMVSRPVAGMDAINLSIQITVAMLAAVAALRFAISGAAITREHIYAALSAYVLAGVFAGALYSVMERTWPGSFAVSGQSAHGQLPLPTAAYFSFVTLATLGYGDVVPISEAARILVVFEAIAGQLYLAVMVARLVSLYVIAELNKPREHGTVLSASIGS